MKAVTTKKGIKFIPEKPKNKKLIRFGSAQRFIENKLSMERRAMHLNGNVLELMDIIKKNSGAKSPNLEEIEQVTQKWEKLEKRFTIFFISTLDSKRCDENTGRQLRHCLRTRLNAFLIWCELLNRRNPSEHTINLMQALKGIKDY